MCYTLAVGGGYTAGTYSGNPVYRSCCKKHIYARRIDMKTMKKILMSLLLVLSAVMFLPGAVQAKTKTESLSTSVKAFIKAAKKTRNNWINM